MPRYLLRRALVSGLILTILAIDVRAGLADEVMIDVRIADGVVVANENTVRVREGDRVTLRWSATTETDVHLHGYNLEARVGPSSPVETTFDAYATGRFPITTHRATGGHATLGYLEVHPR